VVEATEEGNFNLVCNEDELAKHGFTVVEEEVLEDNIIKIRVRRWN